MDIKQKASLFAITSATVLSILKFIAGYKSGSMTVISSGLDSMLDVFMSFINFLAIKKSEQPADKNHLYGHGKVEEVAAITQSLVIISTGVFVIYKAIYNYVNGLSIRYSLLDIGVMVLALLFSFFITSILKKVGEQSNSNTLKVDALHYATDLYSNFAALLAIIIAYFSKMFIFDNLFAVFVGIFIIYQAVKILKNALLVLIDTSVPEEISMQIDKIIENMPMPYAGYHDLRSRYTGSKKYIDFHLLVCRTATIEEAHNMADKIELEINKKFHDIDVLIHIEPCPFDCDMTEEHCTVLTMRKKFKEENEKKY